MTEDTYKPMGTAEFSAICSTLCLDAYWISDEFNVDSITVLGWMDGYGVIPAEIGLKIRGIVDEFKGMVKTLIKRVEDSNTKRIVIKRKYQLKYPRDLYRMVAYIASDMTGAKIIWER